MQKSTLTSQTPINKSAKIYHISDKLIGFWPCLNQDAHLISSQYFWCPQAASMLRSNDHCARSRAWHCSTQPPQLSLPAGPGKGRSTWKPGIGIHLTQFPSAVEQLSRSLFLVLNGCFRGKLEASKTLDLDLKSFKQISCGYLPCGWVCPGTHTLTWSFTVRSSWSNARALSLQGKDRCTVHWTCNELKI